MKKSLKLLMLPAAMILCAGNMVSCSPSIKEYAMISDVGDINDGSFNQSCWEALQNYCKGKYSYDYYRPFADSDFARECAIRQAVAKGAKMIILPGFKFKKVAIKCANMEEYKNVHFILIDDHADASKYKNLISVKYDFQYSGWLAGYAIGRDYFETDYAQNKKLADNYGFGYVCGNKYDSVYPFGYGYIQGILYAAQEFTTTHTNINTPHLTFKTNYAYVFAQDDSACARVKGWVANEGINCVFPCGGKLYQSITEAVRYYNTHLLSDKERNFEDQKAPRNAVRWVGVDGDQYTLVQDEDEKKSIYTSALKDLGYTVQVCLDYEVAGKFDYLYELVISESKKPKLTLGFDEQIFIRRETQYPHDYVGIPLEKRKNSDVLRSFNKVTKDMIDAKIALIKSKKGSVYDMYPGHGGSEGLTPGEFTSLNTKTFKDSEYNKFDLNEKYTNYTVYME